MGDLTKARMELEELYMGIPDDSVNLTFQDLADMQQKAKPSIAILEPVQEDKTTRKQGSSSSSALTKLPSLDFNRAHQQRHLQHKHVYLEDSDDFDSRVETDRHRPRRPDVQPTHAWKDQSQPRHATSPRGHRHGLDIGMSYDDVSVISMASNYPERGQRRRPGIPHSNICTVCSTYIYIFRHRCLVCGRVYCRQCVCIGMGEMTEGRKCMQCLGKRFSQRYIKRAGKMGCFWRYPSTVKEAELKWAEKGPRRNGEGADGRSAMNSMMSRSHMMTPTRTRTTTTTTTATNTTTSGTTPSFVATSPVYSPYSHHHMPF